LIVTNRILFFSIAKKTWEARSPLRFDGRLGGRMIFPVGFSMGLENSCFEETDIVFKN